MSVCSFAISHGCAVGLNQICCFCSQEYRTKKKMEHVVKAAVFGGKTISVVDPHRYAKRFKGFMEELFVRK